MLISDVELEIENMFDNVDRKLLQVVSAGHNLGRSGCSAAYMMTTHVGGHARFEVKSNDRLGVISV